MRSKSKMGALELIEIALLAMAILILAYLVSPAADADFNAANLCLSGGHGGGRAEWVRFPQQYIVQCEDGYNVTVMQGR